jgi:hypothetical protein
MSEGSVTAIAAMRILRNSIEARLYQNEDFRALRALDQALSELSQRSLPKVRQLPAQAGVAASPAPGPVSAPPPGPAVALAAPEPAPKSLPKVSADPRASVTLPGFPTISMLESMLTSQPENVRFG